VALAGRWGTAVMARVLASAALLILLAGCTPARTPVATATAHVEATEMPRPSLSLSVSPTSSATPMRRLTSTPLPNPANTPGPTCPAEFRSWEPWHGWRELDPQDFVPAGEVRHEEGFEDFTVRVHQRIEVGCCGESL
jgi:hypothetical protein